MKLRMLLGAALLTMAPAAHGEVIYLYQQVDQTRQLVRLDSVAPGTLSAIPLTGLTPTDIAFLGMDFRPADGQLYARFSDGGLNGSTVRIDPVTGAATYIGSLTANGGGLNYGFDFDPVADQYRLVSDSGNNRRFLPDGSAGTVDGALTGSVTHIAYSNNVAGAQSTVLYGIDSGADALVQIGSGVTAIGVLGVDVPGFGGFDISGTTGVAYGVFRVNNLSSLFQVNLSTGAATSLGTIGTGSGFYSGLAIVAAEPAGGDVPEVSSIAMTVLGLGGLLLVARRKR